jgi:hypothetical protein
MMKIPHVAMRFIAWTCVIGLAVASWTPGPNMVRTGFNTQLEHMAGYLVAAITVLCSAAKAARASGKGFATSKPLRE